MAYFRDINTVFFHVYDTTMSCERAATMTCYAAKHVTAAYIHVFTALCCNTVVHLRHPQLSSNDIQFGHVAIALISNLFLPMTPRGLLKNSMYHKQCKSI